jgi:hypothetical protein
LKARAAALALRSDGTGLIVYRDSNSLRAIRLGADANARGGEMRAGLLECP